MTSHMLPYSPFLRPRYSGPALVLALIMMAIHFAGMLSHGGSNGPATAPSIATVTQAVYGKATQSPQTEISSASCQPSPYRDPSATGDSLFDCFVTYTPAAAHYGGSHVWCVETGIDVMVDVQLHTSGSCSSQPGYTRS